MPDRHIKTVKEFGAVLRETRRREGLTQQQLALSSGTGDRFIVDLENGKETAQLGKALGIAAALGIKITMSDEH